MVSTKRFNPSYRKLMVVLFGKVTPVRLLVEQPQPVSAYANCVSPPSLSIVAIGRLFSSYVMLVVSPFGSVIATTFPAASYTRLIVRSSGSVNDSTLP